MKLLQKFFNNQYMDHRARYALICGAIAVVAGGICLLGLIYSLWVFAPVVTVVKIMGTAVIIGLPALFVRDEFKRLKR
jgi:hypothetical protein